MSNCFCIAGSILRAILFVQSQKIFLWRFSSIVFCTFGVSVLAFAVSTLGCASTLWSQSAAEEDIWASIVSSRDALVSNEYNAFSVNIYKRDDGISAISEESRIYCAFDELQSAFRFDRTTNGKTTKLVRRPDKTIIMGADNQIVGTYPASKESRISTPFSFKCMGLAFRGDLQLETPLKDMISNYSDSIFQLVAVRRSEANG